MIDLITNYFEQMPSAHRSILLVGGLAFFWTLESIMPYFERDYQVGRHGLHNLFFTLTTASVNLPLAFLLVTVSDLVVTKNFGVVNWLGFGNWAILIIGLLLMDLIGAWLIHYIQHHVKWMWRFHAVHHSDQHLDITSGNRHHPIESIFRFAFTLLAIVIVGSPMWLVMIYQSMSLVLTQFNHSNIKLPIFADEVLSKIIVTPNIHRVHHHYRMPYSDMNYGNIFVFWDKIFGTYTKIANEKIKFGLDTHMGEYESSHLIGMLQAPFMPYRSHIKYETEEKL